MAAETELFLQCTLTQKNSALRPPLPQHPIACSRRRLFLGLQTPIVEPRRQPGPNAIATARGRVQEQEDWR
jgi:hypothetical protein